MFLRLWPVPIAVDFRVPLRYVRVPLPWEVHGRDQSMKVNSLLPRSQERALLRRSGTVGEMSALALRKEQEV